MTPEIAVHLVVTGNFDPTELTTTIRYEPTSAWRSGEKVNNSLIKRKNDGWKLSLDEVSSYDLDVQINKLLSLIRPFKSNMVDFCSSQNLNIEISCVVTTSEDEFPSIHFDKELIDQLNNINASIDIDLY